jgi:photosystem II stability/assembly factor-like uncharacterized protein
MIMFTRNSGSKITTAASGTNQSFRAVTLVDQSELWTGGEGGALRVSYDSGQSWEKKDAKTTETINGIAFAEASMGWMVGTNGMFKRSTNRGSGWGNEDVTGVPNLHAITATNTGGVVVGDSGTIIRLRVTCLD